MASVQFYGIPSVLKAAENIECPAWAIFSGKQFLFKYEGMNQDESIQLLTEILENLRDANSIATYTLKFFEQSGKINEKTICDGGSFNFKIVGEQGYISESNNRLHTTIGVIEKAISDKVAEKIAGMMEDKEAEEKPDTIGDIIKNPSLALEYLEVIGKLGEVFRGVFGQPGPAQLQPAAIGQVGKQEIDPAPVEREYSFDDQVRLTNAINILGNDDPKIIDRLEKLARIKQTEKSTYDFLISMLEKK